MMKENSKQFVVLEHLGGVDKGQRFWSTNSDNNTHSNKGELWYKEILFTDSTEEAIERCEFRKLNNKPISFIIVEKLRLKTSIENSLREVQLDIDLYFDERFIYTDEHDKEHQIQRLRWEGVNISVLINDVETPLKELNMPMLTMLDYKVKNYVSEYLDN